MIGSSSPFTCTTDNEQQRQPTKTLVHLYHTECDAFNWDLYFVHVLNRSSSYCMSSYLFYFRFIPTTRIWNYLESPGFPWVPKQNCQGKCIFLVGVTEPSREYIFLGSWGYPPRNMGVSLAVSNHLQGNYSFPWVLFLTAMEHTHFLGCYSKPSSKLSFPWELLNFLGGWQPRKCL